MMTNTNLKALLQKWVEHKATKWQISTQRQAKFWGQRFANTLKETNQITTIQKINRQTLNQYINDKNKAQHTINNEKKFAKSFFSWCVEQNIILSSPATHLQQKCDRKYQYTLSKQQMQKILRSKYNNIFEQQLKIIIELIYACAIRISELTNLNISSIDFGNSIITIEKGKGNKPRVLPLIPKVKKQLKNYLQKQRSKLAKNQETALFVGEKGQRLNKQVLQRKIKHLAKKLNIRFSCHALRRTCATHLLENGCNLVYIKQLLGHTSLETTQTYLNIDAKLLQINYFQHPRDQIKTT